MDGWISINPLDDARSKKANESAIITAFNPTKCTRSMRRLTYFTLPP